MNEHQRLCELLRQKDEALQATVVAKETKKPNSISAETMECFANGLNTLTPTERLIYEAYLNRTPTKEIMIQLNIKENTLKFHNKNLYSKLGISSRKQLLEVYQALNIAEKSK